MNTAVKQLAPLLAAPLQLVSSSERPIGYVGFDIPPDVMLVSGRPFLHLPWVKGRATPLADRWLESSFPGWARSLLQDWLSGAFDGIAQVVFTRGDDAAQRLYYYICELQRRGLAGGPQPLIFDVAKIRRPSSVQHCERAVRNLLRELAVDEAALADGIAQADLLRRHFARLEASRHAAGHCYENIARASLYSPLWPLLQQLELTATGPERRVLLAGSVPPDDSLHLAAEAVGWNVVGEFNQLALTRLGAPIMPDAGDLVPALARHCHAAEGGSRDFSDRASALLRAVAMKRAEAVVLWLTDEDEVLAWQVARQRTALTAAGIAVLVLARQRWDGSDAACERVRQFLQETQ